MQEFTRGERLRERFFFELAGTARAAISARKSLCRARRNSPGALRNIARVASDISSPAKPPRFVSNYAKLPSLSVSLSLSLSLLSQFFSHGCG